MKKETSATAPKKTEQPAKTGKIYTVRETDVKDSESDELALNELDAVKQRVISDTINLVEKFKSIKDLNAELGSKFAASEKEQAK